MCKKRFVLSIFINSLSIVSAFAQTNVPSNDQTCTHPSNDDPIEVDIPFDEICKQVKAMKDKPKTASSAKEAACSTDVTNPNKSSAITKLTGAVDSYQITVMDNALKMCGNTSQLSKTTPPPSIQVTDQNNKKWIFKFYFGNSKTWYGKTDAKIKTSRLDLTLKGLQPYERRSDSYYKNFFHESPQEMGQVVDEPTNTFNFVLTKENNEVFLKVFHPKFVFVEGDQEVNGHSYYNDNVLVSGTQDGQPINGYIPLKGKFDANHQLLPNNVGFVSWEDSHKLLQPEVGYGRTFNLIKSKGQPILKCTPQVAVGVYLGVENDAYLSKDHNQYQYDSYSDGGNSNTDMRIMGYSGSVADRVELTNRKNSLGLFVEDKFSYGKVSYPFMDGTVSHDITYNSVTLGFSVAIKPKNTAEQIKKLLQKKDEEAPSSP